MNFKAEYVRKIQIDVENELIAICKNDFHLPGTILGRMSIWMCLSCLVAKVAPKRPIQSTKCLMMGSAYPIPVENMSLKTICKSEIKIRRIKRRISRPSSIFPKKFIRLFIFLMAPIFI